MLEAARVSVSHTIFCPSNCKYELKHGDQVIAFLHLYQTRYSYNFGLKNPCNINLRIIVCPMLCNFIVIQQCRLKQAKLLISLIIIQFDLFQYRFERLASIPDFLVIYIIIIMKEKSPGSVARLYRQFSRQKFSKYKHKYPRLKQGQITKKILKEWDSLDQNARANLEEYYQKKNFLADDASEQAVTKPKQPKQRKKIEKVAQKKPMVQPAGPKKSPIRVIQDEPNIKPAEQSSVDVIDQILKPKTDSDTQKQIQIQKDPKATKIKKPKVNLQNLKNGEYLQFFKFYYERLAKEHPRWKPNQLSTIIKLLWRKRVLTKKKETQRQKVQKVKPIKLTAHKEIKARALTGYQFFQKSFIQRNSTVDKKALLKEALPTWKRLTIQGKRFYENEAKRHNMTIQIEQNESSNPFFIQGMEPKKQRKEPKGNMNFLNNLIQ